MESFPPPNYVKIESGIEGFEVYKPAPEDIEAQQPVVDFTCPQCGATMAFSVSSGGLVCSHCGYKEQPKVDVEGKNAAQFEFTVETLETASHGWGINRLDLECQNCGARISIPVESLTLTCTFCGSNKVIQSQARQDNLRPKFLIPFRVDENTCRAIVQKWLGSHWMTPASLKNLVDLQVFSKIFLPYWTFDSITSAEWKAEVGHPTTEQYYDHNDKTWKTRTRIDWRWESGSAQLKIDDLLEAGTARVSSRHLSSVQNFDLSGLVAYEPGFLAGMQAQTYDISLETAWDTARQEMREKTRQACREQASTSMIRNFRMEVDFRDENWRLILLPFFLASYAYQGKAFQILINGQTGAISGQRPVDWRKVWLAIAALLAPGVILGILGLLTLPIAGVGAPIGGVGLFLLIIGLVVGIVLLVKADQLDDI